MAASVRRLTVRGLKSVTFGTKLNVYSVQHRSVVTGNPQADKTLATLTGGRIDGWLKSYEDFVGLTEVREAQNKVIEVGY